PRGIPETPGRDAAERGREEIRVGSHAGAELDGSARAGDRRRRDGLLKRNRAIGKSGHPVISVSRSNHPIIRSPDHPIQKKLLAWFRREKRSLPWRGTRDVYRIWVSEVMLQQTTVGAVRSRYESFLARFPNLRSLARAREESVLAAWSGLGYYARARNLRR